MTKRRSGAPLQGTPTWSVLVNAWFALSQRRKLTEHERVAVMDTVWELLHARDPRPLLVVDWPTEERRQADKVRRETARANTVESASTSVVLRPRDVAARVGLSLGSVYRLTKQGKFPKFFKVSTRATGWYARDVEEWLASRASAEE